MTKRPSKYLDHDNTQINPQWLEHRTALRAKVVADPHDYGITGSDISTYLPEALDKAIPTAGEWVLVFTEPQTDLSSRFTVPPLSMWRARPHEISSAAIYVVVDNEQLVLRPQQAVITTPGGDLHLWAHEYALATAARSLIADPLATIHSLDGPSPINPEQLFYLTSRGIPQREAMLLLFDQITSTDHLYVTFPNEITEQLAGVGTPLMQHISRHPRSRLQAGAR